MAALGEGVRAAFHFYFTAGYPETQRLLVDVVRLLVITRSSAEALPWVFRAWVLRGNILAPELLLSPLSPCSAPGSDDGVTEGWRSGANYVPGSE